MTESLANIRPATQADIAWIADQERRPDLAAFIHRWPPQQHAQNLADADKLYWIAADEAQGAEDKRLGFLILGGLQTPGPDIELVRMAVTRSGVGIGKSLLAAAIDFAFKARNARRLWLDVFDDNTRARRIYQAAGFRDEAAPPQPARKADGQAGALVIMSIGAAQYRAMLRQPPQ